jgi:hypothetical protein
MAIMGAACMAAAGLVVIALVRGCLRALVKYNGRHGGGR